MSTTPTTPAAASRSSTSCADRAASTSSSRPSRGATGCDRSPRAGDAVETIVIEDFPLEPAEDPVIGPEFAAARTRLGLTVDALADRTRIRPHVIESIEVDDFAPCGGDFYARGHVRTLARVLGVDAAPLLAAYDERYADAPVNPRRVFEAELASSGGIRATRGGPNWSVLVAAVMALVLAWSIARLVMDGPVDLREDPVLNGSGGPNHQGARPRRLSPWWSRLRAAVRASSSATAAARWCSPATWRSGQAAPSRSPRPCACRPRTAP